MEQVPDLDVPCLMEPFQNFCPFLHLKINLGFPAVGYSQHRCNLALQENRTALAGPDEGIRYGVPGEHLDERESLCFRIEPDKFVAADHTAYQLAVGAFDGALDDDKVEVIHVGSRDINRVTA